MDRSIRVHIYGGAERLQSPLLIYKKCFFKFAYDDDCVLKSIKLWKFNIICFKIINFDFFHITWLNVFEVTKWQSRHQSLFILEFRNNLTNSSTQHSGPLCKKFPNRPLRATIVFSAVKFVRVWTFLLGSVATNYKITKIRVHSRNSRCFIVPSVKSLTLKISYEPPILNFITVSDLQSFQTRFRGKIWFSNESRAFASTDKKIEHALCYVQTP